MCQRNIVRSWWSLLLGVCLAGMVGKGAIAQTSTSTETHGLTNQQRMNQTGGQQNVYVSPPKTVRDFPIPGQLPLPPSLPIPLHYAKPAEDGNYGSLATLVDYKAVFNYANAKALSKKHGKINIETSSISSVRLPSPYLRILQAPKDRKAFARRYELIGTGNYRSKDHKTISEQVLGIAILEGLKIGADAMLVQEGAAMTQKARGWVIGIFNPFSYVNSIVSRTGVGNVTSFGAGLGKGQIRYISMPWLRVQFYREIR